MSKIWVIYYDKRNKFLYPTFVLVTITNNNKHSYLSSSCYMPRYRSESTVSWRCSHLILTIGLCQNPTITPILQMRSSVSCLYETTLGCELRKLTLESMLSTISQSSTRPPPYHVPLLLSVCIPSLYITFRNEPHLKMAILQDAPSVKLCIFNFVKPPIKPTRY